MEGKYSNMMFYGAMEGRDLLKQNTINPTTRCPEERTNVDHSAYKTPRGIPRLASEATIPPDLHDNVTFDCWLAGLYTRDVTKVPGIIHAGTRK